MKTVIIRTPSKILVKDWHDAILEGSGIWAAGLSQKEALGALICDYSEELGLDLGQDIQEIKAAMAQSAKPAEVFIGYLAQAPALADFFNFEIEVREEEE